MQQASHGVRMLDSSGALHTTQSIVREEHPTKLFRPAGSPRAHLANPTRRRPCGSGSLERRRAMAPPAAAGLTSKTACTRFGNGRIERTQAVTQPDLARLVMLTQGSMPNSGICVTPPSARFSWAMVCSNSSCMCTQSDHIDLQNLRYALLTWTAKLCRRTVAQRSGVRSRGGSCGCPSKAAHHSSST